MTHERPSDWADWEELERTCRRKRPYNSLKMAKVGLARLRERSEDGATTVGIYDCRFCAQYHLGNRRGGAWETGAVEETAKGPRKGDRP